MSYQYYNGQIIRDFLYLFTQREVQVAEIKSLKDARKKHAHLDLHFIYQVCLRQTKTNESTSRSLYIKTQLYICFKSKSVIIVYYTNAKQYQANIKYRHSNSALNIISDSSEINCFVHISIFPKTDVLNSNCPWSPN